MKIIYTICGLYLLLSAVHGWELLEDPTFSGILTALCYAAIGSCYAFSHKKGGHGHG